MKICLLKNSSNTFRLKLFLLFLSSTLTSFSQNLETNSSDSLIKSQIFIAYRSKESLPRPMLNMSERSCLEKLNPFLYLAAGSMFFYQSIISEQISADCMYEISCSEYTKRAIEREGFLKGMLIGLHQLHCCVGFILDDYEGNQVNDQGRIINHIH